MSLQIKFRQDEDANINSYFLLALLILQMLHMGYEGASTCLAFIFLLWAIVDHYQFKFVKDKRKKKCP